MNVLKRYRYPFIVGLAVIIAALLSPIAGWGQVAHAASRPTPFLYRPYYPNQTVISRSISFFDHDKPWYTNDGKFVKFDGSVYTGSAVTGCTPYVNCYDGHNGYDLNMVFEPVLASGAGKVIRAGWYNAANHLDGGGLWVAIDHGNGYVTMYCHLSAVLVKVGDVVGPQWQIGTSGSTGSASGPHLHFTVFQMPSWQPTDPFGWQTNAFADPNVVPDYYLWTNVHAATSSPCLGCDAGAIHPGATVVDDENSGFTTTGSWYAAGGNGVIGKIMHWTHTTAGTATATATWEPQLPTTGTYEVGVYIDPINASSQWVNYTITHANGSNSVWVDQEHIGVFQNAFGTINTGPQWIGLGTYTFNAGSSGHVTVTNATGETNAQLGADAVEFVQVG